jgi:hypothetical protein
MEESSRSRSRSSPSLSPRKAQRGGDLSASTPGGGASSSPRLRIRRRRIADQPRTTPVEVHTIMEEPEEEEKHEIEPCNYENLFETVGGHRFYRRTRPPLSRGSSPPSSLLAPSDGTAASFAGPGHSLSTDLAGPIPRMIEHEFREEGSDHHEDDNDHDINPRSLLREHQHDVADRATIRSLPSFRFIAQAIARLVSIQGHSIQEL